MDMAPRANDLKPLFPIEGNAGIDLHRCSTSSAIPSRNFEIIPKLPYQNRFASSMTVSIRTLALTRTYGSSESPVHALRGLDLEIQPGERVALLGKSGSGKSTLLNLLGGLDRPTSGHIVVGTSSLHELNSRELAQYRNGCIGMIFQSFNLVAARTAQENVELPMIFAGISSAERRERARKALRAVGLDRRMDHRPNQLSGGECQRVAVARALVNDPQVLLADEPTGNLDSRTAQEVMGLIQDDVKNRGTTLLLVTHDEELARQNTTRLIRMHDGQLREAISNSNQTT